MSDKKPCYLSFFQRQAKAICLYSAIVHGMNYCTACRNSTLFLNHKGLYLECSKTKKRDYDSLKDGEIFYITPPVFSRCYQPIYSKHHSMDRLHRDVKEFEVADKLHLFFDRAVVLKARSLAPVRKIVKGVPPKHVKGAIL